MTGELSQTTRTRLCAALLRIKVIHDREVRDRWLSELEKQLGQSLDTPRSVEATHDIRSLVDKCAGRPGVLRSLATVIRYEAGESVPLGEFERVLSAAIGNGLLSQSDRNHLADLLGQVPPDTVAAAAGAVLRSDLPVSLWGNGDTIAQEVERTVIAGRSLDLVAFADHVAHRVERATALDLHRWTDEAGNRLGLSQQDLRSLCLDTALGLRTEPEDSAGGVSPPITPEVKSTISDVLTDPHSGDKMPAAPVVPPEVIDKADVRLIWGGVPLRNPEFTGRESLLTELRNALLRQSKASVLPEALHGSGGVGKTQLAVEYVYRHASDYDLVWWISAEQSPLVRSSLANLGERLHLPASQDMQQTAVTVLDALGASPLRWLLVYDNADEPEELTPLIPSAGGHVIITSRNQAWATVRLGHAIEVDVFERKESIELLTRRSHDAVDPVEVNRLAETLGDLPLALEQAAIWRAATGMSISEYLDLFDSHVQELMNEGQPPSYQNTVYAFLSLAFERLRRESPAGAQLFELFAFLGAEPLSAMLLRNGRLSDSGSPLAVALRDSIAMNRAIRELRRYGLAKVDPNGQRIQVHRLVQLVLREGLRDDRREDARARVQELLALANPGSPDEPTDWPRYREIGPHIRAAELLEATDPQARTVILDYARFLYRTGDYEGSRALSQQAVNVWSKPESEGGLGPDHPHTLVAQSRLANALALLGEIHDACRLSEQTLRQMQKHDDLGEDHEHTLQMANQYARDLRLLGRFQQALDVDKKNLAQHRQVFGDEDERTLAMRNNVAVNLRILGDFQGAYEIDRAVVAQWQETIGDNDVRTLYSVSNLARDLYGVGRYSEALDMLLSGFPLLSEQLPARHTEVLLAARTSAIAMRKVGNYADALQLARENYRNYQARFGDDHYLTLAATMSLANSLRAVGETAQARGYATEAVGRYTAELGAQHPLTLSAQVNLAIILRAVKDNREAYDLDSATVEAMRKALGPKHPYTLCAETGLAIDLGLRHSLKAASALSQQTYEISREVRGDDHPYTLACAINAAFDLQDIGEKVAGQALFDRAFESLSSTLGGDHPEVVDVLRGKRAECDIEPPPT